MAKRGFWKGFAVGSAAGAAAGVGSWLISRAIGRQGYGKIMRLEKSLQIGRPIEEVFRAWSELDRLPDHLPVIDRVTVQGKRSHWVMNVGGRRVEWDAKLTQRIPNQALGWKSLNGPKHTGRINFARLGNDTLVHVVMNYAPPAGAISSGVVEAYGRLEGFLEQALRDFKAALEGKGQEDAERRTGTYGASSSSSRFGSPINAIQANESRHKTEAPGDGPPNPVEYTSPPKPPR